MLFPGWVIPLCRDVPQRQVDQLRGRLVAGKMPLVGNRLADLAVQGHHLIVEIGADELQPRLRQLQAEHHGHGAADDEHREAQAQVERADFLVVGGENPAQDPGDQRMSCRGYGVCVGNHGRQPSGN